MAYAIGIDFGTNTARALVVDVQSGQEIASAEAPYAHGDAGVLLDAREINLARQHPQDYVDALHASVARAVEGADLRGRVVGIGVDGTGSTPLPLGADRRPLALDPRFERRLEAMAWLWKDHTAHEEAAEITQLAEESGTPYLAKCGGVYSSEWFWSKILHCARTAPDVFDAASTWIELSDFIPSLLTGRLGNPSRNVCAAGHKAMFHPDWGGLPAREFLGRLHPGLRRYYDGVAQVDAKAGELVSEHASTMGLDPGIPVAVGAMDAHVGAIGSGVKLGTLVKIMGTSTCDIMAGGSDVPDIPGLCGMVPGSVIPGMVGIEAGQSAVGDLFNWAADLTAQSHDELQDDAASLRPGESGLIALDWNNGNRTVLVDPRLSGLLVGQSLRTTPPEVYRAMIEATAFGALTIIKRIESYGVAIQEVVVCGGIAVKSPLTMQIYADVLNRPIKVNPSTQTCALGAAILGAVAGGAHPDVLTAQAAMSPPPDKTYTPNGDAAQVYARLFRLYSDLHDGFGLGKGFEASRIMKELLTIREGVRA